MIDRCKLLLKKYRETIAYLFVGGTTVFVNIIVYLLLAPVFGDMVANTIAFFVTVIYAYFTNCLFVFKQKLSRSNFCRFWGMRIGALLIDDGGMWLLLEIGVKNLLAKTVTSIILIVLNYIFSKYFIFKKKGTTE